MSLLAYHLCMKPSALPKCCAFNYLKGEIFCLGIIFSQEPKSTRNIDVEVIVMAE